MALAKAYTVVPLLRDHAIVPVKCGLSRGVVFDQGDNTMLSVCKSTAMWQQDADICTLTGFSNICMWHDTVLPCVYWQWFLKLP